MVKLWEAGMHFEVHKIASMKILFDDHLLFCLSPWHTRGTWEETHLPHHHPRFSSVLCSGIPDQTGQQPYWTRGRCAEQHGGTTSAGSLPRRGSNQTNSCWPPGTMKQLEGIFFFPFFFFLQSYTVYSDSCPLTVCSWKKCLILMMMILV